jgi:hypothetical protein
MTAAVNTFARLLNLVPNRHALHRDAPARDEPFAREAFSPGWDDCFVNAAVKAALLRATDLAHAGIHVSTSRGVVQLSGFVENRAVMARAVTLARAVDGVKSVRNDMRRR